MVYLYILFNNISSRYIIKFDKTSCLVYIIICYTGVFMKNKTAFTARHQEITDILRQQIRTRHWKFGEKLPHQQELCREFDVSPITIKHVIKTLVQEGFLRTVRGTGTFVNWKKENEYYTDFIPQSSRAVTITHSLFAPTPIYKYIMQTLADAFMARNPRVNIVLREIRYDNAEDPYLQMFAKGDMPVCGEFFWYALYAKLNMLYPLEKFADFEELQNDLHPDCTLATPDGGNVSHIHALKLYNGIPLFLLFNQELMEKNGFSTDSSNMTWHKLCQIIRIFSQNKRNTIPYAGSLPLPWAYHSVQPYVGLMGQDLFCQTQAQLTPQSFLSIFSTDSAANALENIRSFAACGNILFNSGHERFALGDVGVLPFASSWALNLLAVLNPSFRYFATPIPPDKGKRKYYPFKSGYHVGIFRNAITSDLQLHAAWEWLHFLFHKRSQYLLSQEYKIPARKECEYHLQQQFPALNAMVNNMFKTSVPQPDFPGMRQAYFSIGQEVAALLQKNISPEICLQNIREKLERQFE